MSTFHPTHRLLINGHLVDGAGSLDVVNPATGKVFASAPRASVTQADDAVRAARQAFPSWAALSYAQRRPYLEDLADGIDARRDEIATALTRERGGPFASVQREVTMTAAAIRHFAGQSLETRVIRETAGERILEQRYPQGVVVAITPWNRPLTLLAYKLAPALITGNTLIAKPAPSTPLSTLILGEIAAKILPPGVFNVITDANDLGAHLTAHPDVDHISFTGSTETGRKVMASAAGTLKRFTLELGGNDAAIVLDDADIDAVAPKIFAAAMINTGQVCYATKRIYAPSALVDRLCDALAAQARQVRLGDGFDPEVTMGPLQNKAQYDKVLDFFADTRGHATFVTPDGAAAGASTQTDGYFIAPTIVRDIAPDARLVREEQFGPIVPVLAYDDLDEAIRAINASPYGLGGSVWTANVERGIAVASRIESGTVWVNQHMALPLDVPFGGAKQSGMGLQNGRAGMEDFTQLRIVNAKLG